MWFQIAYARTSYRCNSAQNLLASVLHVFPTVPHLEKIGVVTAPKWNPGFLAQVVVHASGSSSLCFWH